MTPVVVEDGWSGTLFVKNGTGSNILEILGNQEDMDVGFVDGKVQLTIGNGSKITIDEQFVTNPQTGKVELSENGFEHIKTYGHDANGNALAGEYAYASYFVLGSEEDNLLVANQPSDAEDNDEVFIMAGDGADIIEGNASNLMIEGGRGDDLIRIAATSGNKSVFGDIFSGDSGGNVQTQNTNYSDVVEIDWSYYDSEISSIAGGYRIYNEDLAATVDIYDIEVLKFKDDNAAGGWDTRYLTDGQVIGTNEWHGDFAGTEIDYEGDNVSFVVDGDTLKVMADVTITTFQSSSVNVLIGLTLVILAPDGMRAYIILTLLRIGYLVVVLVLDTLNKFHLVLLMKLQKRVALFGKVSVVRLMPLSLQAVSQLTLSMLRIRTGMISLLRQL